MSTAAPDPRVAGVRPATEASAPVQRPPVEARWRELVKEHHPDRGGDAAAFNRITDAVRQGRVALGHG